jgi:hypothetical protein
MACCAILLDARAAGKLVDDRPLPIKDFWSTRQDIVERQRQRKDKEAEL